MDDSKDCDNQASDTVVIEQLSNSDIGLGCRLIFGYGRSMAATDS